MRFVIRNSRVFFLILAIILALPIPSSFIGGMLWLSPWLFLITVLSTKTFVLLNLFSLGAIGLITVRKRFVCRYLCPLGVVCDQVSKIPGRKRKLPVLKKFNKTLALFALGFAVFGIPVFSVLDPFYIFHTLFEPVRTGFSGTSVVKLLPLTVVIAVNLTFPGSWCSSLCPLGGLQMLTSDLKHRVRQKNSAGQKNDTSSDKSRRLFISGLAGISLGVLTIPLKKATGTRSQIKPPSALHDEDYYLSCIRCGSCISACPTHVLYQQRNADLLTFLAPAVDFSESYCLPECTNCGDVCPSGALKKFTPQDKYNLTMATASVEHEKCLLFKQKECNQCELHCAYDAISFQKPAGLMTPVPVFDPEKCVGCAACKIVCPENAIQINPV